MGSKYVFIRRIVSLVTTARTVDLLVLRKETTAFMKKILLRICLISNYGTADIMWFSSLNVILGNNIL
jgi:hypothetical protein